MKVTKSLLNYITLFFLISCTKSSDGPVTQPVVPQPPPPPVVKVTADFEATLSGKAPAATLNLVNKSEGADSFLWIFSQGGSLDSSLTATPPNITIDKKGTFTVTLTAKKGTTENTITKSFTVEGYSALLEYKDLKFGIHNLGDLPYCFSTSEGRFYQRSEISAANGPKIDLVLYKDGINWFSEFLSPNDLKYYSFSIPGARKTEFINYSNPPVLTTTQFDAMQQDSLLTTLSIVDNTTAFNGNEPAMILFKNSDQKKGAIKVKSMGRDHLLVDIKMQKYRE